MTGLAMTRTNVICKQTAIVAIPMINGKQDEGCKCVETHLIFPEIFMRIGCAIQEI